MHCPPIALAAILLLLGNTWALADDLTFSVDGEAYSVNDFAGFSILGSGLTIDATNDFCCGGFSGIIPGQSYTESFTANAGPGAFSTFEGFWGNTSITGNGSLSWDFDFVIPAGAPPGSVSEIEVPATVTGYFDFCSPPSFEEVSSCGPGENPLGSGTLSGTGTLLAYLDYDSQSGTYGSDEIYLTDYTATANADIVPEPSTFFLFLGGLPLIWYLKMRRRSSPLIVMIPPEWN